MKISSARYVQESRYTRIYMRYTYMMQKGNTRRERPRPRPRPRPLGWLCKYYHCHI